MVVLWFITDYFAQVRTHQVVNTNIREAATPDPFLPEANHPVPHRTSSGAGWVTVFTAKM